MEVNTDGSSIRRKARHTNQMDGVVKAEGGRWETVSQAYTFAPEVNWPQSELRPASPYRSIGSMTGMPRKLRPVPSSSSSEK